MHVLLSLKKKKKDREKKRQKRSRKRGTGKKKKKKTTTTAKHDLGFQNGGLRTRGGGGWSRYQGKHLILDDAHECLNLPENRKIPRAARLQTGDSGVENLGHLSRRILSFSASLSDTREEVISYPTKFKRQMQE